MSGLPPIATEPRTSPRVRFVPDSDSCTAVKFLSLPTSTTAQVAGPKPRYCSSQPNVTYGSTSVQWSGPSLYDYSWGVNWVTERQESNPELPYGKIPKGEERVMGWMFDNVGRLIARLQRPASHCEPFTPNDSTALRDTLRPGDVLLVERKGHISGSIKYLTQSTWSHSALYVGPMASAETDGEPHVLIEANIDEGVVSAPLSKYLHCQTRICRPVGLSEADCEKVCRYAIERIGLGYDFKNVADLMGYLFQWPVAQRWRRRRIALGSGDASRIICSSLIAQAFDAVRYPILPKITRVESQTE